MGALPKTTMSISQFVSWAEQQGEGRYELVHGEVVMMSPETVRHAESKGAVYIALRTAIASNGLPCSVFPDGVGVVIDKGTVREPDVSVQCEPANPDSLTIDAPVIVVEVLSPSSIAIDTGAKKDEYFRIPSIRHYLIVDPYSRLVIHYHRDTSDGHVSRIVVSDGAIMLSPPGISVSVDDMFGEVDR